MTTVHRIGLRIKECIEADENYQKEVNNVRNLEDWGKSSNAALDYLQIAKEELEYAEEALCDALKQKA